MIDFEHMEGGSLNAYLNGGDATPVETPVVTPPANEVSNEQVPADGTSTRQAEDSANVATPDATIDSQETPTDAVTKEGTEASSEESASPDAQQTDEELKTPKALRDAYDSLKSKVNPYSAFIDKVVENEVSPALVEEAYSVFDSYVALDNGTETDASGFLSNLYQLSPTAFQTVAQTLINDNKDFISKQLFGTEVTAEDVQAFKQFKESGTKVSAVDDEIVVPEFDPVSGEPLAEEIQNMIKDNVLRARQAEAARKAVEDKTTAEQTATQQAAEAQRIEDQNKAIDTAIGNYRSERLKIIDNTIAKLHLQPLPTDTDEVKTEKEMMAAVIKGATVFSFGSDAKAQTLYRQAVDYIADGKERLAQGHAFNIEKAMGEHAAKIGKFVSDLYAKANQAVKQQVQQAATGDRPEISNTGAAPTLGTSANSYAPLSSEGISARLAELEASGRLPRR